MKKFLKGLGLVAGVIAAGVAIFVWGYAPIRAKALGEQYTKFRAEFQAAHDAIDARFNQQDRTVNGLNWHYIDEGAKDGQVILFLHGLPEGWYSWGEVLPLVDHSYRLIAIDMKGYGRSDVQDSNYEWHAVAGQVLGFMDSLGIQKFTVVSHDWGTIIGSVLVSDHPDRIQGYVRMEADLIQSADKSLISAYLQKPQWLLFQNNWIATYMMQDAGWFIDFVYKGRMTTPLKQEERDYLTYEFSRPGVAEKVPAYFLHSNWDLDTAIGSICANTFPFPVLQLQADSDPAQPKSIFADVPAKCPNVQLEWVTGASHFDNYDQPGQVADAINRFMQAVSSR